MAIFAYGPALPKSTLGTLLSTQSSSKLPFSSLLDCLRALLFIRKDSYLVFLYLRFSFLWELLKCKTS